MGWIMMVWAVNSLIFMWLKNNPKNLYNYIYSLN